MHLISEIITYTFIFIALYFEIFFLITYFELRATNTAKYTVNPKSFETKLPTVSIIVPVWNEENTVLKTIFSLLKLDYPKEKLSIFIIDDGSTDKTWNIIQRFKKNKQIHLLKKENGGKHTALNYGLQFVTSELVGSLDADSFVHPQSLRRLVVQFEDQEMMAVTPSVKIHEPEGVLGLIQKAEYMFGIFLRKIFSHLNAIYITPGPFSIFRTIVFQKIGNYDHAHNTEDMEMAMRMQKNNMKIGNVHDAFVYTIAPTSLSSLYKQRLRWTYGFIKNSIDYRYMFFKPQYGNLGMAVLPAAGFSIISSIYFFWSVIWSTLNSVWVRAIEIYTVGISFPSFNFDYFYINTDVMAFVSIIAVLGTIFIIVTSRRISGEDKRIGLDSFLFLGVYMMLAPIWISKAVYNVMFGKISNWR